MARKQQDAERLQRPAQLDHGPRECSCVTTTSARARPAPVRLGVRPLAHRRHRHSQVALGTRLRTRSMVRRRPASRIAANASTTTAPRPQLPARDLSATAPTTGGLQVAARGQFATLQGRWRDFEGQEVSVYLRHVRDTFSLNSDWQDILHRLGLDLAWFVQTSSLRETRSRSRINHHSARLRRLRRSSATTFITPRNVARPTAEQSSTLALLSRSFNHRAEDSSVQGVESRLVRASASCFQQSVATWSARGLTRIRGTRLAGAQGRGGGHACVREAGGSRLTLRCSARADGVELLYKDTPTPRPPSGTLHPFPLRIGVEHDRRMVLTPLHTDARWLERIKLHPQAGGGPRPPFADRIEPGWFGFDAFVIGERFAQADTLGLDPLPRRAAVGTLLREVGVASASTRAWSSYYNRGSVMFAPSRPVLDGSVACFGALGGAQVWRLTLGRDHQREFERHCNSCSSAPCVGAVHPHAQPAVCARHRFVVSRPSRPCPSRAAACGWTEHIRAWTYRVRCSGSSRWWAACGVAGDVAALPWAYSLRLRATSPWTTEQSNAGPDQGIDFQEDTLYPGAPCVRTSAPRARVRADGGSTRPATSSTVLALVGLSSSATSSARSPSQAGCASGGSPELLAVRPFDVVHGPAFGSLDLDHSDPAGASGFDRGTRPADHPVHNTLARRAARAL